MASLRSAVFIASAACVSAQVAVSTLIANTNTLQNTNGPSPTSASSGNDSGLPAYGIAIIVVVLVLLLFTGIFVWMRHRSHKRESEKLLDHKGSYPSLNTASGAKNVHFPPHSHQHGTTHPQYGAPTTFNHVIPIEQHGQPNSTSPMHPRRRQ